MQLAAILRDMIKLLARSLPGTPLPSINTLTQRYGVAKGTAHKALGVIRDEGLAVAVPGRGFYVKPS